jgi:hypothetical protein
MLLLSPWAKAIHYPFNQHDVDYSLQRAAGDEDL